jgi:copper chaperone
MKTEVITIANLKCDGCENTIKSKLSQIQGVIGVEVNNETDTITVIHNGNVERSKITEKLQSLGYPEATEENSFLLKIKSYASCAVGKIKKAVHESKD